MSSTNEYILGRSPGETRRLVLQDQLYRPLTRHLFVTAGIGPGMKVLDVGSGAGDVALLLAELVGNVAAHAQRRLQRVVLDGAHD